MSDDRSTADNYPSSRNRHRSNSHSHKKQQLKLPSVGLTPASPTTKVPATVQEQLYQTSAQPPMPQFFLSTTASNWYERRTSSPQTPGEVLMATISPVRMAVQQPGQPPQSPHGSFLTLRPLSPAASVSGHLNIPMHGQSVASGSISSFDSHHSQPGHRSPMLPRTPVPGELSQDVLVHEISRLREKLQLLESENTAMTVKLSSVHTEFEGRLAEIESQMVDQSATGTTTCHQSSSGNGGGGRDVKVSTSRVVDMTHEPKLFLGSTNNRPVSQDRVKEAGLELRQGTGHRSDVTTSPVSEMSGVTSTEQEDEPSSSCGSEELSERNRESII